MESEVEEEKKRREEREWRERERGIERGREEEFERRKTWNPRIEKNASYFSKGKVNALDFSFF